MNEKYDAPKLLAKIDRAKKDLRWFQSRIELLSVYDIHTTLNGIINGLNGEGEPHETSQETS